MLLGEVQLKIRNLEDSEQWADKVQQSKGYERYV